MFFTSYRVIEWLIDQGDLINMLLMAILVRV
jgi:hypothetical protein